ncbi:hypothetical protein ES332_A08G130400v1 [Gossypium tomentosum]|uniref:Uncharacterized protein n=1 Tax=Gossypium tomentosum TaxID=34277 RepID=A0A5D2PID0_GOSTO|nr:hypothetical protein ES332_A08G130400v1 [Gossypium tomentosum]
MYLAWFNDTCLRKCFANSTVFILQFSTLSSILAILATSCVIRKVICCKDKRLSIFFFQL